MQRRTDTQRIEKYRPRNKRYDTDPIKRKASQAVRDAVRHGKIIKPVDCQNCGIKTEKRRLEGHHYLGYDFVLDIVWLCRECHAFAHTK